MSDIAEYTITAPPTRRDELARLSAERSHAARSQSAVAVLIPCFNEETAIGKVIDDFRTALPDATVYVYDNNSTDRTMDVAKARGAVVRSRVSAGQRSCDQTYVRRC